MHLLLMARFLGSGRTTVIIDPLRLEELIEILEPVISGQIELADLFIISKADLASVIIETSDQTSKSWPGSIKVTALPATTNYPVALHG